MEFLIFIGGIILGIVISKILRDREKIHGIIHVDHDTEQCIFSITNYELLDHKKKTAIFIINHDAKISRDEQGL